MITSQERLRGFRASSYCRFDCGIEDPLIEHNRTLHTALTSHQIPHLYEEYKGGHTWGYWEEHIEQTLLLFEKQY